MDWLAERCGVRKPEDWYEVRKAQFKTNCGGGLLASQYGDSVYEALRDYRPEFDWLPWKFPRAPNKFWCDAGSRRRYMYWLAAELGFRQPEDWYCVTKRTFVDHNGAGLLLGWYGDSVSAAVSEYCPGHQWHAWLFSSTPQRFWHNADNRRAYMKWLGEQLQFKRPEDWYAITKTDFQEHHGSGLLHCQYGDSPQKALREFLPELPQTPWLFTSVPQQFWHDVENRLCYLKWLGQQLNFQSSSDWFGLLTTDFKRNHGGGLLDYYARGPLGKALAEVLRESGSRKTVIWPVIQLIECSSSGSDPQALFRTLAV